MDTDKLLKEQWKRLNENMDIVAEQKFLRMSPRKIRYVANLIRGMSPVKSIEVLPHAGRRASEPLIKVIKSALANGRQKGVSESELVFKEILVNQGPTLKRGNQVSRGRWHPIKKRTSHIRVVLTTIEKKVVKKAKNGTKS